MYLEFQQRSDHRLVSLRIIYNLSSGSPDVCVESDSHQGQALYSGEECVEPGEILTIRNARLD